MDYFSKAEKSCRCGCGLNLVDRNPKFLQALNTARALAGIPFKISSMTRCVTHNKAVGGVDDSSHTLGLAVDIVCNASTTRKKILDALLMAGFTRIGIGRTFIHADMDDGKPKGVIWLYD